MENFKFNNFGNNVHRNGGGHSRKNKNSPSPVSFRISNNTNMNYKKSVLNNQNNLLLNNNKKFVSRKKAGNSPNNVLNQNSTENYDNSGLKNIDKIYQSSSSNKKRNFPLEKLPLKI